MATDYRESILIFKFFVNAVIPIMVMIKRYCRKEKVDAKFFSMYIFNVLNGFLVLRYIWWKSKKYTENYLRKIYIPSRKVIMTNLFTDVFILGTMYYLVVERMTAFLHFGLDLILYSYLYVHSSRSRIRRSSFEQENIELAVVDKDIGDPENEGIKEGELVKIVRTTTDGYLIKKSDGTEFRILKSQVREIIQIK